MKKSPLANAREMLGWTQTQLAEAAEVSVSAISELERGHYRNPSFSLVMRVVGALQRGGLKGLKAEDLVSIADGAA